MMKKLLFMAALLVPGLAYGQNPSADVSVQVVPGSDPPNGIACAIGPNASSGPTGVAATDTATAGFTTCALNSDFSTSFFANLNNWLGGANSCGGSVASPIWQNVANGAPQPAPCSDITIVTDGSNGQVLDLKFTNADFAVGHNGGTTLFSGFIGGPGQLYSTGIYFEWRGRVTTQTIHSYDGAVQGSLIWGPFKYVPTGFGSGPAIEWDFDEMYAGPPLSPGLQVTGSQGPVNSTGGVNWPNNPAHEVCPRGCTNFDPTITHTYGNLITTDGNQAMSVCYYIDGTKLGCDNYTSITPAVTPLQARETLIMVLGPESFSPTVFNGPQDVLIQYVRVFSCGNWNSASAASAVCAGPVVTN
jgi:hypothetical protein